MIFFAVAKADPPAPNTTALDKQAVDDPDGVPYVLSHRQTPAPTANQIKAERQRKDQAEQDKDWLLRAYEQELQKHAKANQGVNGSNLYYQLASDKTLSKIAGLTFISPTSGQPSASTGANSGSSDKSTSAATAQAKAPPIGIGEFKPLVTPLGAADAAGLHNFYDSIPAATTPIAASPSSAKDDAAKNASDLDMPGQVAAQNNPLYDKNLNLNFDSSTDDALPNDTSSHATLKALPASTASAQLPKSPTLTLSTKNSVKNSTLINAATPQVKTDDDSTQMKLPPPSFGRQPIANPYSILDR